MIFEYHLFGVKSPEFTIFLGFLLKFEVIFEVIEATYPIQSAATSRTVARFAEVLRTMADGSKFSTTKKHGFKLQSKFVHIKWVLQENF